MSWLVILVFVFLHFPGSRPTFLIFSYFLRSSLSFSFSFIPLMVTVPFPCFPSIIFYFIPPFFVFFICRAVLFFNCDIPHTFDGYFSVFVGLHPLVNYYPLPLYSFSFFFFSFSKIIFTKGTCIPSQQHVSFALGYGD